MYKNVPSLGLDYYIKLISLCNDSIVHKISSCFFSWKVNLFVYYVVSCITCNLGMHAFPIGKASL